MNRKLKDSDRRIDALNKCLKKLSKRDKHLINLRYKKDMATKEISLIMDSSVDAIYKAFSRAYNSLRICVQKILVQGGF